MPIYEYQCQNCAAEMEVLQKISDAPLRDCPECGEPGLKKKVSAAAFRLKGGGWYETDFKTSGKKNLAGESDGAKTAGSGDGAGKSSEKTAGSGDKSGGSGSSDSAKSA